MTADRPCAAAFRPDFPLAEHGYDRAAVDAYVTDLQIRLDRAAAEAARVTGAEREAVVVQERARQELAWSRRQAAAEHRRLEEHRSRLDRRMARMAEQQRQLAGGLVATRRLITAAVEQ